MSPSRQVSGLSPSRSDDPLSLLRVIDEKASRLVEHALRGWKCVDCDRDNETLVALDGTVKCAHCAEKVSIQPSRDYLSRLSTLHPEVM